MARDCVLQLAMSIQGPAAERHRELFSSMQMRHHRRQASRQPHTHLWPPSQPTTVPSPLSTPMHKLVPCPSASLISLPCRRYCHSYGASIHMCAPPARKAQPTCPRVLLTCVSLSAARQGCTSRRWPTCAKFPRHRILKANPTQCYHGKPTRAGAPAATQRRLAFS